MIRKIDDPPCEFLSHGLTEDRHDDIERTQRCRQDAGVVSTVVQIMFQKSRRTKAAADLRAGTVVRCSTKKLRSHRVGI